MVGLLSRFQRLNLLPITSGKISQSVAATAACTGTTHSGIKRFHNNVAVPPTFASSSPLLNQTTTLLCKRYPGVVNQTRDVTKYSKSRGKMRSAKIVVRRFKRLGNGLWIRRQAGYKHKAWRKRLKCGGPQIRYRQQRHIFCTSDHNKLFDKMVTPFYKRQRWTVTDPYKGYDEHVKFYYNPFDFPGVNKGRTAERREYFWRRIEDERARTDQTRKKQGNRSGLLATRRKVILKTNYFH